jgi:glycosyltransferase involved in cell wall biosynthesis
MARKLKVHLVGGDDAGWALDMDLRLTKEALTGLVDFVPSPDEADVIHTVCVEQLVIDPRVRAKLLPGKHVVAHFTSIPTALFEQVPTLYEECRRWVCVTQTREAEENLRSLGMPVVKFIPYVGDLENFFHVPAEDPRLAALRAELKLPAGKYVVGSFQRDTLGSDLTKFKPQKGADILAAILLGVQKRVGDRLHVLLAGPRRHWLRNELERHGIGYTFDGKITAGDDYPKNILSLERINLLTNLCDLYIVPSRWEGAPQAIFETIAARRKIISTDVAVARDILPSSSLFTDLTKAIDTIVSDIEKNTLAREIEPNHEKTFARHSVAEVRNHWKNLYAELGAMSPPQPAPASARAAGPVPALRSRLLVKPMAVLSGLRHKLSGKKTITMWGEMVSGPYGGGSQVLKAIAAELERRGYAVANNSAQDAHGHIMNSAFFDVEKARSVILGSKNSPKVVHRIDGPISLYRGKDRELDEAIFRLNREVATATAFQCYYSWHESVRMGFTPVAPMIIRNASDPEFFFKPREKKALEPGRRIRIISTSWSTNMRKGFETYKWLDEHLDFGRFEYRFVGRAPFEFRNIELVDAVASPELGNHLRRADIYITASLHDPASNSLLEALNCGLPVVYAKSGGHSEIAGFAGRGFDRPEEVPGLLEAFLADFESYRACTYAKTIGEIADQYLSVLEL